MNTVKATIPFSAEDEEANELKSHQYHLKLAWEQQMLCPYSSSIFQCYRYRIGNEQTDRFVRTYEIFSLLQKIERDETLREQSLFLDQQNRGNQEFLRVRSNMGDRYFDFNLNLDWGGGRSENPKKFESSLKFSQKWTVCFRCNKRGHKAKICKQNKISSKRLKGSKGYNQGRQHARKHGKNGKIDKNDKPQEISLNDSISY